MSWPSPNFSMGDQVVGPPVTSAAAIATWIPEPRGFDSMCRVNGPLGRFLKDRTEEIKNMARALAPVDTGALAGGISIAYGKWEGGIWGEVYATEEYAPFQEFGTVNHPAHPFLRPALEAVSNQYDLGSGDWSGEAGMLGDFSWDAESREWIG
jgi:hypothetical protein